LNSRPAGFAIFDLVGCDLGYYLATSSDGAGLLCGVLKHFLQRGVNCPKVLVATHFHDLFREDLLDPETSPISFRHMQVMFSSSNGTVIHNLLDTSELDDVSQDRNGPGERKVGVGEKITYLYR
jgi:DNA mismatch repair protein MSH5